MYRFVRTMTISVPSQIPAAMQFAAETTSYVNRTYGVNWKFGAQVYAEPVIHWHLDFENMDKFRDVVDRMYKDPEYWNVLQKGKGIFVEGSMKDALIRMAD